MGFSFCTTFYAQGITGYPVIVEADIQQGLPKCTIVGLADTAVQEARERIRSAIKNQQLAFPRYAITINLVPSTERKTGAVFDVAIALSVLAADDSIPPPSKHTAYFGELTLSGQLRPIKNIYVLVRAAKDAGLTECVVASANGAEASMVEGITVRTAETLGEICLALQGNYPLPTARSAIIQTPTEQPITWNAIIGNELAKKALKIAAICGEHILMVGSPGCGKTMLAQAMMDILPPLTPHEAREVTAIASTIARPGSMEHLQPVRPFRSPHHTASAIALVGGGNPIRPGEISLAHRGVLFLDELAEFSSEARECLREPMEEGKITVARANGSYTFPAQTTVIAAMNPCPCGNNGHPRRQCKCSPTSVNQYHGRISGPLASRFGITLRIDEANEDDATLQENAQDIREQCNVARQRWEEINHAGESVTPWTPEAETLWEKSRRQKTGTGVPCDK